MALPFIFRTYRRWKN